MTRRPDAFERRGQCHCSFGGAAPITSHRQHHTKGSRLGRDELCEREARTPLASSDTYPDFDVTSKIEKCLADFTKIFRGYLCHPTEVTILWLVDNISASRQARILVKSLWSSSAHHSYMVVQIRAPRSNVKTPRVHRALFPLKGRHLALRRDK